MSKSKRDPNDTTGSGCASCATLTAERDAALASEIRWAREAAEHRDAAAATREEVARLRAEIVQWVALSEKAGARIDELMARAEKAEGETAALRATVARQAEDIREFERCADHAYALADSLMKDTPGDKVEDVADETTGLMINILRGREHRQKWTFDKVLEERNEALAEVARLRAQVEVLTGAATPWPLRDVLTRLADAADHLLGKHGCDAHGYEEVGSARDAARRIAALLRGEGPAPAFDNEALLRQQRDAALDDLLRNVEENRRLRAVIEAEVVRLEGGHGPGNVFHNPTKITCHWCELLARLRAALTPPAPAPIGGEGPAAGPGPRDGVALIAEERARQMSVEGWDPGHDDEHDEEEIAWAAVCYAAPLHLTEVWAKDRPFGFDPWPWNPMADKRDKHPRLRRLIIAGALIAAEIDRLNRAPCLTPTAPSGFTSHACDSGTHLCAMPACVCACHGRPAPTDSPADSRQARTDDNGRESPYQLLTGAWQLAIEADGPEAGAFFVRLAAAVRALRADDPALALRWIEVAMNNMRWAYHRDTAPDMRIAVALDGARLKLKGMLP